MATRLGAPDRHATAAWVWPRIPSLFGLAPCGVYPAPALYSRGGALLPHLFTLTLSFTAKGGIFSVARAVCRPCRLNPGRYPAHCPAEFGLSSPEMQRIPAAIAQQACWIHSTAKEQCKPLASLPIGP